MATEDVKLFLFEKFKIAIPNWKRVSKRKDLVGSEIRVFKDRLSGKTVETIEDKNGIIGILNDSEISTSKPKVIGYYQFDEDNFSVAIVTKEFWDINHCLDDSGSEEEHVPYHFFELSEGIYEHDFNTHEEACAALEKVGFVAMNFIDLID